MGVGEDEAVGAEDDAGAGAFGVLEGDDAWGDLFEDLDGVVFAGVSGEGEGEEGEEGEEGTEGDAVGAWRASVEMCWGDYSMGEGGGRREGDKGTR